MGWLILRVYGNVRGAFSVCVCVCLHLPEGVIDVAAEWMSDLKEGFCPSIGYYNKEACCWFNNEVSQ